MKKTLFLAVTALLTLSSAQAQNTLRLMTYNIKNVNPAKRKAIPIKNEKRFSEQKRKAMKIIKAIPEIVSPLLLHC